MEKPIIFISHTAEEKGVAIKLKDIIVSRYVGAVNVFVSSDPRSIKGGERWLDKVEKALKNCNLELIICSPDSIKEPWINFEAGAGWIREIPVMPLCHLGLDFDDLPVPLNLLEAVNLFDEHCLERIFSKISELNDLFIPNCNATEIINVVEEYSKNYDIKKLGILNDANIVNVFDEYCKDKKIKSIVSYADRNALILENDSPNDNHIKAFIDFSYIPKEGINQNFVMVLLQYLPHQDWSGLFTNNYTLKFKYKFSSNIKGLQLEIKNSDMEKIVDEFIPNKAEGEFSLEISKIGVVDLWKDIKELCFTVFHGNDYIDGDKGTIEIYDFVLMKK